MYLLKKLWLMRFSRDSFKADDKANFLPRTCCSTNKKHDKREPGSCGSRKKFFIGVARHIAHMATSQINSS